MSRRGYWALISKSSVMAMSALSLAAGGCARHSASPPQAAPSARNARRERPSSLAWLMFHPGNLRNEVIESGEGNRGIGRKSRRGVRREGRQCGVADQEHVEILGEILIAGRRPAITHVRRVSGEHDVPHLVFLKELLERRIPGRVVDDDIIGMDIEVL